MFVLALLFLYGFTGCDTVSSWFNKGKCKIFDGFLKSELKQQLIVLFIKMMKTPDTIPDADLDLLFKFVLELYALSWNADLALGDLRMGQLLKLKDNDLRKLIPTKDSILQHALRAAYQVGYLWREAYEEVELPDPCHWGYTRGQHGKLIPLWGENDYDGKGLVDLIAVCSCRTAKCKICKCAKSKNDCLPLCGCLRKCLQ